MVRIERIKRARKNLGACSNAKKFKKAPISWKLVSDLLWKVKKRERKLKTHLIKKSGVHLKKASPLSISWGNFLMIKVHFYFRPRSSSRSICHFLDHAFQDRESLFWNQAFLKILAAIFNIKVLFLKIRRLFDDWDQGLSRSNS